ncbi:MAG: hypothetical protein IIA87_01585 [Nanoarchaeota archaeon]|nr:hypothetical protein [Nanoarchaeota archaeon]
METATRTERITVYFSASFKSCSDLKLIEFTKIRKDVDYNIRIINSDDSTVVSRNGLDRDELKGIVSSWRLTPEMRGAQFYVDHPDNNVSAKREGRL